MLVFCKVFIWKMFLYNVHRTRQHLTNPICAHSTPRRSDLCPICASCYKLGSRQIALPGMHMPDAVRLCLRARVTRTSRIGHGMGGLSVSFARTATWTLFTEQRSIHRKECPSIRLWFLRQLIFVRCIVLECANSTSKHVKTHHPVQKRCFHKSSSGGWSIGKQFHIAANF